MQTDCSVMKILGDFKRGLLGGDILTRHNNINLSTIYQLRASQEYAIPGTFLAKTSGYLQFIQQHTLQCLWAMFSIKTLNKPQRNKYVS